MSDDLVQRLKRYGKTEPHIMADYSEVLALRAADRIKALEAKVAAADALAKQAELFADSRSLTIKGLVDALAAYRKTQEGEQ